ncbi:hypothetical protein ACFIOY_20320 [Bradyrhizobium sp. TZ2]
MTSAIDERLVRLLGGAELSDLRARLRRRYELGPADGKLASIQVGKLNEAERAALASWSAAKAAWRLQSPSTSAQSTERSPMPVSRHPFELRSNFLTVRSSTEKLN